MQLDALRLPWPAEPRHDQPHHRPGHYVATVTQSMEGGLVEDDCVVDLTTSQHRSTARTHHKDYPQRDGEVAFEHASQDVRDTALMAIHHLTEILFVGDDPSPHGPLHVTHVYMRGAHGWRLVSRHASAADDGHQAMAEAVPHTLH